MTYYYFNKRWQVRECRQGDGRSWLNAEGASVGPVFSTIEEAKAAAYVARSERWQRQDVAQRDGVHYYLEPLSGSARPCGAVKTHARFPDRAEATAWADEQVAYWRKHGYRGGAQLCSDELGLVEVYSRV